MKMASNDAAPPSSDGAANLVPEINNEVMALEPVAGAQLAAPVAGQFNAIDPWIRQNFVQAPEGEFTVSPRNAPGEILLNLELGPHLNPFLQHLAQMYNAYAGGMEVQVVLAGNAFTAGKIIFAAIPPHFPPERLSAAQATQFPHVIVDVRQLEPIVLPLPDVRHNLFHFNQQNDERMHLVAFLYTPLRANSGNGDDVFTVSCRVLTRPSQDFEFMFLVPPTVEKKTVAFSLPQLAVGEMSNSRWPARITGMVVDPRLPQVLHIQNGRCTLDGTLMGTTQLNPNDICRIRGYFSSSRPELLCEGEESEVNTTPTDSGATGDQTPEVRTGTRATQRWFAVTELNGQVYDPFGDQPAPLGVPDFKARILGALMRLPGTNPTSNSRFEDAWVETNNQTTYAPATGVVAITTNDNSSGNYANDQTCEFVPLGIEITDSAPYNEFDLPSYGGAASSGNRNLAPTVAPTFPGEAILLFGSNMPVYNRSSGTDNKDIRCLLPNEYVQHLYDTQAPSLSDVALVRYVNRDTGRVLFEAKLHRDGFMTVNASSTTVLPVDGYFRFDSWVNQFYALSPVGNASGRRGRSRQAN
uniref:VP1 n=1 Tax=Norovirus dog/GVI.1/Bari/91/2007/ITA TaxID=682809 RepID=C9WSX0_NORV|nr:VP1 [Norovirus dog/GVI.1/Bari/91/2007/ITA]